MSVPAQGGVEDSTTVFADPAVDICTGATSGAGWLSLGLQFVLAMIVLSAVVYWFVLRRPW